MWQTACNRQRASGVRQTDATWRLGTIPRRPRTFPSGAFRPERVYCPESEQHLGYTSGVDADRRPPRPAPCLAAGLRPPSASEPSRGATVRVRTTRSAQWRPPYRLSPPSTYGSAVAELVLTHGSAKRVVKPVPASGLNAAFRRPNRPRFAPRFIRETPRPSDYYS